MKKTIFIAAPAHDGRVETSFLCGCIDTDRRLKAAGIHAQFYFNSGESLVQRARNNICKVFLNSICAETGEPFTHLLQIDTDLGFNAYHVERILEMADYEHHVIAGIAPIKTINWEAVREAAANGAPTDQIAALGSRNVLNAMSGYDYHTNESLVPVKYCGTGFLLTSRECLLDYAEKYPELKYAPDYKIGDPAFDSTPDPDVTAFFDVMICPEERRYLSEDYTFCKRARAIGYEIYVCRDCLMPHVGKYAYPPHPAGV